MDALCQGWRVPQHMTDEALRIAYVSDRYASAGGAPLRTPIQLCPACNTAYIRDAAGRVIPPEHPKAEVR